MVGRERELGSFGGCAGWPTLFDVGRSVSCCIDPIGRIIKARDGDLRKDLPPRGNPILLSADISGRLTFFLSILVILDFDLFRASLALAFVG